MAKNKTDKKKNKMKTIKKAAELLVPAQMESVILGVANPRRIRL